MLSERTVETHVRNILANSACAPNGDAAGSTGDEEALQFLVLTVDGDAAIEVEPASVDKGLPRRVALRHGDRRRPGVDVAVDLTNGRRVGGRRGHRQQAQADNGEYRRDQQPKPHDHPSPATGTRTTLTN